MHRPFRSPLACSMMICLAAAAWSPAGTALAQDESASPEPPEFQSLRETFDKPVVAFAWGPASLLMMPQETVLYTTKALSRTARADFLRRFWGTMARNCPEGRNPARELFWKRVGEAAERFDDEPLPGWLTDRGRVWILRGPPEKEERVKARLGRTPIEVLLWRFPEEPGLPRTIAFRKRGLEWFFIDADPQPAEDDPDVLEIVPERFGDLLPRLARHFRTSHACELTEEQKAEQAKTRWRRELWEIADRMLAGEDPGIEAGLEPQWTFLPAEKGATFVWLTFREPKPPAAGRRYVALLRAEGRTARYLGTDDFPFVRRELGGEAGVLVQAARSVEPGRYAVVIGTADAGGSLEPLWAGRQLIVRLPEDRLRLSSVVLARSIRPLEGADGAGAGPFRFGGFEVVPRMDAVVHHGEELGIFYQVLGAAVDEQGRADLKITYQFQIRRKGEFLNAGRPVVHDHAFGASQAWSTPIVPQWPPTEYRLQVTIQDNRTGGTVSASVPFRVEP